MRTILVSIQSLLGEPNNDSPLNGQAAMLWANQEEYRKALMKSVAANGNAALAVVTLAKAGPFAEEDAQAFSRGQEHPNLARLVAYACQRTEAAVEEEEEDESKGGGGAAAAAAAEPLPGLSLVFELPPCGSVVTARADPPGCCTLLRAARFNLDFPNFRLSGESPRKNLEKSEKSPTLAAVNFYRGNYIFNKFSLVTKINRKTAKSYYIDKNKLI